MTSPDFTSVESPHTLDNSFELIYRVFPRYRDAVETLSEAYKHMFCCSRRWASVPISLNIRFHEIRRTSDGT
jgi:hypothetical protein